MPHCPDEKCGAALLYEPELLDTPARWRYMASRWMVSDPKFRKEQPHNLRTKRWDAAYTLDRITHPGCSLGVAGPKAVLRPPPWAGASQLSRCSEPRCCCAYDHGAQSMVAD